jgi:opacity protein-like surface antigen
MLLMAVTGAGLISIPAAGQVNPEAAPSSDQGSPSFKYTGYAGFAYTSLNQVNQSRYGLIGAKFSLTRNWGRYFGLSGIIDYYKPPLSNASPGNPGDPSVYTFMLAPEVHANLYEKLSGLFFGEVGGEHTGGEEIQPGISFAGGFGGGLEYAVTSRFSVRVEGDKVAASFTLRNDLPGYGYSTHRTWNPRGSIGVVYHF